MQHHIVLTSHIAKVVQKESLEQQTLPRTDLDLLAQSLNASFIKQEPCPIKRGDKIRAKIYGTPENWAFARFIKSQVQPDDVIFCPGEEIGIPLARIYSKQEKRPTIIVWFHRITGLRTRIALKIFKTADSVDLSVVNSRPNQVFLKNYLDFAEDKILYLRHPIDCKFFTPGSVSPNKTRPIVASIGLEQRDYRLLAAATEQLDVDVKVAGFSQFQPRIAKSFPKVMPKNMTNKKYLWSEFLQLYYDADVVVISLKENSGAAGGTALLEAMSCKKAIVCVRTRGLEDYLSDKQAVMTIKPKDVAGLQQAILYLLDNPEEARSRAEQAYQIVRERHNLEKQVEILAEFIQAKGG